MNRILIPLALLALGAACTDSSTTTDDTGPADTGAEDTGAEDTGTDTGDTGTTVKECVTGETVTIDGDTYTIGLDGLSILVANPNLAAGGFQDFEAYTCDWITGDAYLNIFQTGVTDLANGWDEEHTIASTLAADGDENTPRTDMLSLKIDHVDSTANVTNTTTAFNTDDLGGLTYALRVYDADSNLADCIAWGHDVSGMFAGQVPTNGAGHTNQSEISAANCADLSR